MSMLLLSVSLASFSPRILEADAASTCSDLSIQELTATADGNVLASVDNNGSYRQRDEILSKPGGTAKQNIVAWRTDDTVWNFKYLTAREI